MGGPVLCGGLSALDAAARLWLSRQQRDPYGRTRGSFDRRYWAWKMVDAPDASLQRAIHPLALLYRMPSSDLCGRADVRAAVEDGIAFATRVQHANGAWDQAFPNDQSFAATAFLTQAIAESLRLLAEDLDPAVRRAGEEALRRGVRFLVTRDESHGRITNHVACAALALRRAGAYLGDSVAERRSEALLDRVRSWQSPEGWFPEYGGADPGYQTLTQWYLAELAALRPDGALAEALDRSASFLSCFLHPDGSYGGVYGSRRTAVCYPAGFALRASRSPVSAALWQAVRAAAGVGRTPGPADVDMSNGPTLLAAWIVAEAAEAPASAGALPRDGGTSRDFPDAGLFVRGTSAYYAVVGARNGGVLYACRVRDGATLWRDGGWVGEDARGVCLTSQQVGAVPAVEATPEAVRIASVFTELRVPDPTPAAFLVLRLVNLLMMRSVALGQLVKRLLVRRLIASRRSAPLTLTRTVRFEAGGIVVEDRIARRGGPALRWLECGREFSSIHMASAGYRGALEPVSSLGVVRADAAALNAAGTVAVTTRIDAGS